MELGDALAHSPDTYAGAFQLDFCEFVGGDSLPIIGHLKQEGAIRTRDVDQSVGSAGVTMDIG